MNALALALRTLLREWKSGELGVLVLAITVAVAALTGVGFLVNRIGIAVDNQAGEVLAADLRLESGQAMDDRAIVEARRRGLEVARIAGLFSVVFNGDINQLTSLRAVSDKYPLRGRVMLSDQPFGAAQAAAGNPSRGEVWPDSRLAAALGAGVGTELSIGARTFRVARILITRPDQGATFLELAPSLIMNEADLDSTQLIQPGSRMRLAQLFAGQRNEIAAFKEWLEANKKQGEEIEDVADSAPQIKSAIDRSARFLSIASLVAVLLCAIAVAMAARRYVHRHLDSVALLKTLGATRGFTLTVSLVQLTIVGILAAILGSILGFGAQAWLVKALAGLLRGDLPAPGLAPLGIGFLTAIAVLGGFALPPLLQLSRTPALRVLRRDIGPPQPLVVLAFGPAVMAIAFLIYWVLRDQRTFLVFVIGLSVFVAAVAGAGWLLVKLTTRFRGGVGVSWRYGIANLGRRRTESVVQLTAFALGIMMLLLLAVVRNDLLNDWRRSLPADTPNFFFINIPPDEHQAFTAFLEARGAHDARARPMVRARMTRINGKPVDDIKFATRRGREFANRDQNITWAEVLGTDNTITAGHWFTPDEFAKPLVSVSTEYMEEMSLKLGDSLEFDIAGETRTATISSVRDVKWDSFQPNFFLMFAPGLLEGSQGTWMTAVHLQTSDPKTIADLVRRFPSVSVFNVDDLLRQVRSVIDKAVAAVQSVFLFTLMAGLVVLIAAVQASREERRYESAMLRTLGANRATVLKGLLSEFAALGVLSGTLAAAGASIAGVYIARRVLQIPYTPDPWVWFYGLAGGGLLVCLAGWLATRSVVNQPPLLTLRSG
ncbi:MAG TPA: FtsX-like permease family protein [Steroidobacteraceae bacterium]|jgi:putative ABC transport system permease protein|nr:FtsX-like permease family protein [Steroidobacteraceae bacterium]